jgi:hypothetical protein
VQYEATINFEVKDTDLDIIGLIKAARKIDLSMADVCEAMASEGLCAYPGGEQSVRVIPEALEFIRVRAEALPDED